MVTSARDELRGLAFWADALTDDEAERARRGISERQFPAGSYICHRGDKLDFVDRCGYRPGQDRRDLRFG